MAIRDPQVIVLSTQDNSFGISFKGELVQLADLSFGFRVPGFPHMMSAIEGHNYLNTNEVQFLKKEELLPDSFLSSIIPIGRTKRVLRGLCKFTLP